MHFLLLRVKFKSYLQACIKDALKDDEKLDIKVNELLKTLKR